MNKRMMGNPDQEQETSSEGVHHPLESGLSGSDRDPTDYHRTGNGIDQEASLPVKIPIIGFETMEERAKFTIFKLKVEHEKLDDDWLVFRRYTDFVRLYAKLKEEIPNMEIMSLPPKRWLGDNFETAFLEERTKGLQAFIDSILVQPSLVELPIIRKFFCLDEPPTYSDMSEETKSWCGIVEDSAALLRHKLIEKERETELLRTQLALVSTQKDNLLKLVRGCQHCCQKQIVFSALGTPSCHWSGSVSLPSSGSSSEQGSPCHRVSLPSQSTLLQSQKHNKNSCSSKIVNNRNNLFRKGRRFSNGSGSGSASNSVDLSTKDHVAVTEESNKPPADLERVNIS